jgi:hypothetical protein
MLIALWDGNEDREGHEGAADIVQFAVRSNMPLWWIDTNGGAPKFIAGLTQWRHLDTVLEGDKGAAALREYLAKTILTPVAPAPDWPGVIGYVAQRLCNVFGYNPSPLDRYIAEKPRALHRVESGALTNFCRSFGIARH